MDQSIAVSTQDKSKLARGVIWIMEHWLGIFILLFGIFWVTPFFAPVFMRLGWTGPAQAIYTVYSTQCHQMAQRSFFFFGPKLMYNAAELPITLSGNEAINMLAFREFIGNTDLGWKVAWSDRMVSMYGGIWVASIAFVLIRRSYRSRSLYTLLAVLLLFPMAVDGITHFLSDISGGLMNGFRYSNQWLANLTGNALPSWFYVGDAFGSFNSWMRLLTGILFGIGVVWLAFPILDRALHVSVEERRRKYLFEGLDQVTYESV